MMNFAAVVIQRFYRLLRDNKNQQGYFKVKGSGVALRISDQMAAFPPRFHPKQVHFEGCWLKGVAIYCAIRGGRSGRGG